MNITALIAFNSIIIKSEWSHFRCQVWERTETMASKKTLAWNNLNFMTKIVSNMENLKRKKSGDRDWGCSFLNMLLVHREWRKTTGTYALRRRGRWCSDQRRFTTIPEFIKKIRFSVNSSLNAIKFCCI